ncbi:tRNA pseudouridine synthase A [Bombiscardovia nodaiensis]|uniref:tRNA pseudouridine synthase A n=1 Tax=Bombiscardovia nodaiensis TaxID=2932181 RepID=A0ABM8B6K5_9BIFI|nr:tRNA pseudouridine synthase A [Bombiscardovia nodaiensis]
MQAQMVRLRIDLAYDGSDFYGWARQPGLRTVQGELEGALRKVLHLARPAEHTSAGGASGGQGQAEAESEAVASQVSTPNAGAEADAENADESTETGPWEPRLVVAGRTDTGVHAAQQVCHLDIPQEILLLVVGHMDSEPALALERRLQHVLPFDIAVHSVTVAPKGFDARFSALERTYVYRVCDNPARLDPRMRAFVLPVRHPLDIEAMNEAAAAAIGLHDFGSFATANEGGTTIRQVKYAHWDRVPSNPLLHNPPQEGGEPSQAAGQVGTAYQVPAVESGLVCFTIVADAFAHNMVRSLVNACLRVGQGKQSVHWFRQKLAQPVREGATGPVEARGLSLEHVSYPPADQLAERAQAIRAKRSPAELVKPDGELQ